MTNSNLMRNRGSRGLAFHFFPGHAARFGIGRQHVGDGRHLDLRSPREHSLDHFGDAGKRNPPIEKRLDGHFVRRVEGAWISALLPQRLARQTQARKTARRNLFEIEAAQLAPVQTLLH